jgi:hypothetical protein
VTFELIDIAPNALGERAREPERQAQVAPQCLAAIPIRRTFLVEQKIYQLNELCDFVIGYEGGLGHLAHVLGIPYFCLPWRLNDMGHLGVQPGLWYESHRFHPDRRTWFLHDVEEFVGWNCQQLQHIIDRLYDQNGNNILFDPGTSMDPANLEITAGNGQDLTPRIMWCTTRGKYTTAFVKEHLPVEHMQKYPLKSMTYNA